MLMKNAPLPSTRQPDIWAAALLILAACAMLSAQTPAAATKAGAGIGGFKIGDTVKINTAFGWIDAKVLKVNGNSYYVHAQSGADVWKPYPTELRRIGPLNAEDRAHGLYQLHDRVQVNIEGRWMDAEVITELGDEYQVTLTDQRTAWAKANNLRLVPGGDKPLPALKGGTPPNPGMVSCAGKIEGRYSSSSGFGNFTVVFRSGKATVPDLSGGAGDELECWMSGTRIILRKPGAPNEDMPIDINNDGTLDTPLGEIRKKGN
jgi:hypothetical protein